MGIYPPLLLADAHCSCPLSQMTAHSANPHSTSSLWLSLVRWDEWAPRVSDTETQGESGEKSEWVWVSEFCGEWVSVTTPTSVWMSVWVSELVDVWVSEIPSWVSANASEYVAMSHSLTGWMLWVRSRCWAQWVSDMLWVCELRCVSPTMMSAMKSEC